MKKILIVITMMLVYIISFGEEGYINSVWYNVYQINLLNPQEAKGQIDTHFRMFKELKVNRVFFLVKNPNGRVYYNSKIAKPVLVNDFVSNKNDTISWDVLDYVIKKGKENKIEIYPYINVFAEEGYYLEENKDFAEKRKDGRVTKWVSPAIPQVRERISAIVSEIVTNYDIDGIQLDRVRYEDYYTGFNNESVSRFKEKYGKEPQEKDEEFIKFKKDQVTAVVEMIYNKVKEIKPDIKVTAAVFHSPSTSKDVLQNWTEWLEKGIIDDIYTMTYTNEINRFKKYVNENAEAIKKAKNPSSKIIIGMGPYYKNMTPEILAEETKICFEKPEISGVCWFSAYNMMEDKFYNLLKRIDYENKIIN